MTPGPFRASGALEQEVHLTFIHARVTFLVQMAFWLASRKWG